MSGGEGVGESCCRFFSPKRTQYYQQFVEKKCVSSVIVMCLSCNVKMAHIPDTILLQMCVYECVRPH